MAIARKLLVAVWQVMTKEETDLHASEEDLAYKMLVRYIELLRQKPYVIGEHIWNMCDFKTSQGITRVGVLNYKGVFTRDRRPKLAAHRIRAIWR